MAQVGRQQIQVNNRMVGTVSVDGGAVRGEGGPSRPHLVVPLAFDLEPSSSRTIVVLSVVARLATEQHAQPSNEVCSPVAVSLVNGFPARSLARGGHEHIVHLRFPVTAVELEALERIRHGGGGLTLYVGLDIVVAGMRVHNDARSDGTPTSDWPAEDGLLADVTPYWDSRVAPVAMNVEPSAWIRNVLPGLGYDRVRLLELRFPPPLPDNIAAATEWDKAVKAFDEYRYDQCVAECRDLIAMWKKELEATNKDPVAEVVARRRGWPETDARRPFLAGLWKSALDLINSAHHPEGAAVLQRFEAADARLVLVLTAALADYVAGGG